MPYFLHIATFVHSLFKSRHQLRLENLALRQQLAMLKPSVKRPQVSPADRLFWILFSKYVDGWRTMLHALHPDTVVRWHREGFKHYWTWKSRRQRVGRLPVDKEIRKLIRQMQSANIGWGAPRIHGELLKLGIDISQAAVSKYMVRQQKPPSQTWRTFLENHADCIAGIDFFTVPTATFRILYVFIVLCHDRRHIVHFNVTAHPTAQWTAQQLVEAFPFESAPRVCCVIGMPFTVRRFDDGSRACVSRRSLRPRTRLGKTLLSKELSGPYDETVWIILLFSMRGTCVESFASTSVIIILAERTYR
jgi:hypothetical protein